MKYCSNCGTLVELRIPEGDTLPRHVCSACNIIHYQNPKIVVGSIPEWEDRILLCRRAIEPRQGLWTLPGGFMENAETLVQGAERETLEEANARVEMGDLYSIYNLPHINQVHVLFRARMLDLTSNLELKAWMSSFSTKRKFLGIRWLSVSSANP